MCEFSCHWLWWFLEKERICFRKDDLSVLESGECQSLVQVCERNGILLLEQFASHAGASMLTVSLAGASIFKSLPSVWQQLEGDFHCRLGRGKGSLLFLEHIKLEESFASDHRNAWISTSLRKRWTMWFFVESCGTCGLGKGNSPVARSEQGGSGRKGKNKTRVV